MMKEVTFLTKKILSKIHQKKHTDLVFNLPATLHTSDIPFPSSPFGLFSNTRFQNNLKKMPKPIYLYDSDFVTVWIYGNINLEDIFSILHVCDALKCKIVHLTFMWWFLRTYTNICIRYVEKKSHGFIKPFCLSEKKNTKREKKTLC